MKRLMICTAAALVVAVAPVIAIAGGCGDGDCSVGAFGQGGVASEGKAQGTLVRTPSNNFPGATISESGNGHAGRISVTNQGSISGGTAPDGTIRGHGTGIFGDWSGQCDDPFGDPDAC